MVKAGVENVELPYPSMASGVHEEHVIILYVHDLSQRKSVYYISKFSNNHSLYHDTMTLNSYILPSFRLNVYYVLCRKFFFIIILYRHR